MTPKVNTVGKFTCFRLVVVVEQIRSGHRISLAVLSMFDLGPKHNDLWILVVTMLVSEVAAERG